MDESKVDGHGQSGIIVQFVKIDTHTRSKNLSFGKHLISEILWSSSFLHAFEQKDCAEHQADDADDEEGEIDYFCDLFHLLLSPLNSLTYLLLPIIFTKVPLGILASWRWLGGLRIGDCFYVLLLVRLFLSVLWEDKTGKNK